VVFSGIWCAVGVLLLTQPPRIVGVLGIVMGFAGLGSAYLLHRQQSR